jgi:signal transduction histidine kinase
MKEQHDLQTKVQGEGSFAIPDADLQVLLYNCVRELLMNVVQHAGVKEAVVLLQKVGKDFQVEVRDQGKGFVVDSGEQLISVPEDESRDRRPSRSLATIRHQLSLFGGRMEIQSAPGAGTEVILIVPVSEGL